MTILPPDYSERRGDRVLLIWGELPFWMVVDRPAASFIEALAAGRTVPEALQRSSGKATPDWQLKRDAAQLLSALKQAGVTGNRRLKPPRERIESISINVTTRCNLRCRFCYNNGRSLGGEPVSTEEMLRALESIRGELGRGGALALLGGEPLLEPDKTLALAAWGRRRRLSPIVSTNGLLVTPDFAQRAAATGLDCQVSLDGATAAAHEAIRGPGTYDQALRGLQTFLDGGAHTIVSMVFHAGNVAEIPDFLRLAQRLGAHEARFIPLKRVGGHDLRPPKLAEVIRTVTRLLVAEPHLRPLLGRDYVSILGQTCLACSPRRGCGTGAQTFLLDADGAIYPCPNLAAPALAAGNIREKSLRDIWRHSQVLADVRRKCSLPERSEQCAACFARHWCLGGCRGEVYAVTGNLTGPSVTCAENRAALVEMFWQLREHPQLLPRGLKHC